MLAADVIIGGRSILCLILYLESEQHAIGFDLEPVSSPAPAVAPLDRAESWLKTCATHHDCSSRYKDLQLPTRLISIAEPSLSLVETNTCMERPVYATLSYCWGNSENMKLTESLYDSFCNDIPEDQLEPTYRDAIEVARALGLQWIWIDALCIIQDQPDHRDWRSEAALMGDIYGGGYINLAASTSSDVKQGMFTKPEGYIAGVTLNLGDRFGHIYLHDAWKIAVTESTLSKRGWAFQERLLAPRTLYLSSLGLFWECSEHRGDEYSPDGFEYQKHMVDELCLGRRRAWEWEQLVKSYSHSKLSHLEDKLIAMSGLARCQQALICDDKYLAGLWEKSLKWQLMWYAKKPTRRTRPWTPTWSWASVDCGVFFEVPERLRSKFTPKYTILTASTQLIGSDVFGDVASGTLKLACSGLIQARLEERRSKYALMHEVHWSGTKRTSLMLDCSEDPLLRIGDSVYLLPCVEDSNLLEICSLALQTCNDGHFRRIGLHRHGQWAGEGSPLHDLLAAGGDPATAAAVCPERTPDGRYVVTIV